MKKLEEGRCPECGNKTAVTKWYDDKGIVEDYRECYVCGYEYHWSYGKNFK